MDVTAANPDRAAPAPGPVAADTGPGSPASGKDVPVAGKNEPPARPAPPPISIDKALEQIQTFLSDSKRQLTFQFDESSRRTVIRVLNPATGEVIRQIPSEEVLKVAAYLQSQGLHTFDELA